MNEALRFGFPLAATCYALWRSRVHPLFFLFFAANLIYELGTEVPYLLGWHYNGFYAWFTALWLLFGAWITWDSLYCFQNKPRLFAIPIVITIGLTRLCYLGIGGHLTQGEWITLLEGSALLLLGQILGAAATYCTRYHNALLGLSLLWLAQFLFLWGYLLHDSWTGLYWMPAIIVGMGFLAVGLAIPQAGKRFPF